MTLYFFGTVTDFETVWNGSGGTDYGNWFTDHASLGGAHTTVAASALPTATDDVVILTGLSNLGVARTVNTAVFSMSAFGDGSNTLTCTSGATFNSASNDGIVTGNATFNDSSYNNGGTVTGDATFNDGSYNDSGSVGNATFNGSSSNNSYGTVIGNATFNDVSSNDSGSVGGTAYVHQSPAAFLAWRSSCTPYYCTNLVLQFPQLDVVGTGLL
jgi:hypothetical protein